MNPPLVPRRLFLAAAALLLATGLHAQLKENIPDKELVPPRKLPAGPTKKEEVPPLLRVIMHPLKRGMLLTLPVVDTDPNRGITSGFMPIWVIKESSGDRIEQIHAPSISYNKYFGPVPTYRYYNYPASDSSVVARAAVAKYEHEVLAQFEDATFLGKDIDFSGRCQFNMDSGQRFFGIGPDSQKDSETNYREDYLQYRVTVGAPLKPKSLWRVHLSDMLTGTKIADGPIPNLPAFSVTFPGSSVAASDRELIHADRLILDYDSRDHPVTTSQGTYLQAFAEYSVRNLGSEEDYSRYGVDARHFHPWDSDRRHVTAARFSFEQQMANAPFWLQSRLGGKYGLRAYGDGRYTDRGVLTANLEQRYTYYKAKMAGVTTEFEAAPFAGLGTVFPSPQEMAGRYTRPVVGLATRAVARPQVVGSIDFGMGQEGLAVFMDINYSF